MQLLAVTVTKHQRHQPQCRYARSYPIQRCKVLAKERSTEHQSSRLGSFVSQVEKPLAPTVVAHLHPCLVKQTAALLPHSVSQRIGVLTWMILLAYIWHVRILAGMTICLEGVEAQAAVEKS